jgi:hypothetical protein
VKYFLRSLIFVHRWVGIALCVVFLFWFPSGIGMMYWTFPEVTAGDRLDHSSSLDPAKIVLSPEEAAAKVGIQANPTQVRLNSFDGRPVYRVSAGGGRGGRGGGGVRIVYADTGEEQTEVSTEMLDRIASAWAARPLAEAKKVSVEEPDQWTVAGNFRNLQPLYKYSWPDGQQVYLNGNTGEIVQYATFAKRVAAHVSAIPHWLYYTPLRKHQPVWLKFMIWSSLIGTAGAMLGVIVAVWMYSPKKRYRLDGQPTGIPYRGQKRWHWIFGMVFGVATVTWTFSGLMTLGPFPIVERLTQPAQRQGQRGEQQQAQQQQSQQPQEAAQAAAEQPQPQSAATPQRGEGTSSAPRGEIQPGSSRRAQGQLTPNRGGGAQPDGGAGGGGPQGIANALRGRVSMTDFASVHPRDLLARVPNLSVKELEWTSFAGTPLLSANLGSGKSQLLSLDGSAINGFDPEKVIEIIKGAVPDPKTIDINVIDEYDLYYLDRTRQRPLPVIRVLMNDEAKTRYYVDPKSARVVTTYSNRNWVNRWLYSALHSLNFPFLYNHRPLWDIVVITFMVGGTALCVTSLVLAWRTLGRKLKRVAANDLLPRES